MSKLPAGAYNAIFAEHERDHQDAGASRDGCNGCAMLAHASALHAHIAHLERVLASLRKAWDFCDDTREKLLEDRDADRAKLEKLVWQNGDLLMKQHADRAAINDADLYLGDGELDKTYWRNRHVDAIKRATSAARKPHQITYPSRGGGMTGDISESTYRGMSPGNCGMDR